MKKIYQIVIAVFVLLGCTEKDSGSDALKCITGNWTCISGLEIIGSDTIEFFQNGQKHTYWYGKRTTTSPSTINLSVNYNGQYHFKEDIQGHDTSGLGDIFDYTSNWKLLNTTKSNTFIDLKKYFQFTQVYSNIFKIEELSDSKLVVVSEEDNYYMKYEFTRAPGDKLEHFFSQNSDQSPHNITSNWTLTEFQYSINDSLYTKFANDTLYEHYSEYIYHIPVALKIVRKSNYSLKIQINNMGDMYTTEKKNLEKIYKHSYWYWTDNNNPHKKFKFRFSYVLASPYCEYDIISLTNNELILKNEEHNIELKFHKD